MNPEEDTIFLCVWLLYYANIFADSQMKKRRYRRMDINGFNVVLEKFSFDLKLKKKTIELDGGPRLATRQSNNFTVDKHFESIWFQALLSPQRTNVTHG